MIIRIQEVLFIDNQITDFDVNQIAEYFVSNFDNTAKVWPLPLIFPDNAVSQPN